MKKICFLVMVILMLYDVTGQKSNLQPRSEQDSENRVKRQQEEPDPTDQFFDSVFQIPISTLNAVNSLIKSTRPVIRRARERIQQQYQSWQQPAQRPQQQQQAGVRRPRPSGRAED